MNQLITILKKILTRKNRFSLEDQPLINTTSVDNYWNLVTVHSEPFKNEKESLQYLEWRFEQYPHFRELMDLWGSHDEQVIMDYGCGPANDLVGFLNYTNASQVIGIDVSTKALNLAKHRLALHEFDPQRVKLIKVSDALPKIPLEDLTIDYIYCEGVLHHTSNPQAILKEFHRTLKKDGNVTIMIYNRDSLWFNLYVAYDYMILHNKYKGESIERAFSHTTDGEDCPIARCYQPEEFIKLCLGAGFNARFEGGYFSQLELDLWHKLGNQAIEDKRLPIDQKEFLNSLIPDSSGYPKYMDKYAGIGGVYTLEKVK
jgi:SAM-dependent methyltransferase